jgi:hypothetical protein
MEIHKGMYGLPQAGILTNKLLTEQLARHGYFKQPHTPDLWKHVTCPVCSTYVWTILVLSILDAHIYNTYTMHYAKKHMKLWKIGRATYIAGFH